MARLVPAWLLGVLLTALGNTMGALGVIVEKISIMRHVKKQSDVPEWRQGLWLAGFATFLAGNILTAVALSFAAASVLAPLNGLTIVMNAGGLPLRNGIITHFRRLRAA